MDSFSHLTENEMITDVGITIIELTQYGFMWRAEADAK